MAANKVVRFGPTTITAAAKNLVNPNVTSIAGPVGFTMTQPYVLIRHIRILNTTASAITTSLFVGATAGSAAGTEIFGSAISVPANSFLDWYGLLRLDAADFLTSTASGAGLTFDAEGEVGIS